MTNFIKWIEYLATGNDYSFNLVTTYDMDTINLELYFMNRLDAKAEQSLTARLELNNFEPKKLQNWRNATQEFAYSQNYINYYRPVKQKAQNLLKLIEELKHNRIELKHLKNKIHLIMFYEENIILEFEDDETFKFENGHFKELNQTTEFKKLIYYFKVAKITMEQK